MFGAVLLPDSISDVLIVRFDYMSEVWTMLKSSLPEFTLPDLAAEPSVEAVANASAVCMSNQWFKLGCVTIS